MVRSSGDIIAEKMLQERLTAQGGISSDWYHNTKLNPGAGKSAPPNPYPGLIAYADGINWDPGSGEGPYMYTTSGWVFMG